MKCSKSFTKYLAMLVASNQIEKYDAFRAIIRLELAKKDYEINDTWAFVYNSGQDIWPHKIPIIEKTISNRVMPMMKNLRHFYKSSLKRPKNGVFSNYFLYNLVDLKDFEVKETAQILSLAMKSGYWTGQIGYA